MVFDPGNLLSTISYLVVYDPGGDGCCRLTGFTLSWGGGWHRLAKGGGVFMVVGMSVQLGPFDPIEDAIAEIAAGRPVVVADDEDRENEGDLILAASLATTESINMMIRWARGLICVPMTDPDLQRLNLSPMVQQNREAHGTAFTVSVDAAQGITTGISAAERTTTIRLLGDPKCKPGDLVQPGHVFPLRARPGGVLERAGHTEAAIDLARLAGLPPVGVVCEILNDDGSCARLPQLIEFKKTHGVKMVSIAHLIDFRHRREQLVTCVHRQSMKTAFGDFDVHLFRNCVDGTTHYALTCGQLDEEPVLVRVHSENVLGDVFQVSGLGKRNALMNSLEKIAQEGRGVLVYMSQPGGGVQTPLKRNVQAKDTFADAKMDFRAYGIGAQILAALGVRKLRLLSTTSRRVVGLDGYGLEIVEQVPVED